MSIIVSLGIVLLAGLIVASLQVPLGSLLLLYHSSLGRHVSAKTKRLVSSFISGAAFTFFILLAASCFLVSISNDLGVLPTYAHVALFVALFVLGMVAWFFYYRRRGSTELWLPRPFAEFINSRAEKTSSDAEAFSLGFIVVISELLFTTPLFVVSADAILHLKPEVAGLMLGAFTLLSILPLIVLRISLRTGKNLADVQRWRKKHTFFFRVFTGFGFVILAGFLFAFVISGGAL